MKLFVFLILLLIAAFVIPFAALGHKNGDHMADTLKNNRVYVSQDKLDNFKRENE